MTSHTSTYAYNIFFQYADFDCATSITNRIQSERILLYHGYIVFKSIEQCVNKRMLQSLTLKYKIQPKKKLEITTAHHMPQNVHCENCCLIQKWKVIGVKGFKSVIIVDKIPCVICLSYTMSLHRHFENTFLLVFLR